MSFWDRYSSGVRCWQGWLSQVWVHHKVSMEGSICFLHHGRQVVWVLPLNGWSKVLHSLVVVEDHSMLPVWSHPLFNRMRDYNLCSREYIPVGMCMVDKLKVGVLPLPTSSREHFTDLLTPNCWALSIPYTKLVVIATSSLVSVLLLVGEQY